MNRNNTLKIIYSALCLCLALVLPLFTGQIRILGKMLNLMHIPIFLCGMLCGWKYGGLIGFITPLLRSVIFGMPNLYPNAVGMAFELGIYGLVSGILYKILYKLILLFYQKFPLNVYFDMLQPLKSIHHIFR